MSEAEEIESALMEADCGWAYDHSDACTRIYDDERNAVTVFAAIVERDVVDAFVGGYMEGVRVGERAGAMQNAAEIRRALGL